MTQYDVDGELKQYISHIKIILQNFLSTYDEQPDVKWWNSIMQTKNHSGCGVPLTK